MAEFFKNLSLPLQGGCIVVFTGVIALLLRWGGFFKKTPDVQE